MFFTIIAWSFQADINSDVTAIRLSPVLDILSAQKLLFSIEKYAGPVIIETE